MTDFWRLDATAQAELVRLGEVSALELTEAAISRIERLNPHVNAVIHKLYDSALARARDRASLSGPFAGVPLLVKDASLQIQGTPYTIGTTVLRDMGYRSDHTTELARRLLAAGFIVLGKTNCPETSSGVTTEPEAFGATHNPWDLTRTPGGSSGGSAAAVACGMVSIAHGGDATGSLRYPASMCGIVTLKPTRGLVPSGTPSGLPEGGIPVWAEFMLARSIRDLAGVLDAVSDVSHVTGRANRSGDLSLRVREEPRFSSVLAESQEMGGLRIGVLTSHIMLDAINVHDECVQAVERTGAVLESLGHHVEVAHPPALDGQFSRIASAVVPLGVVYRHREYRWLSGIAGRDLTTGDVATDSIVTDEQRAKVSDEQYAAAQATIARESAALLEWWEDHDVLVTPVAIQPPWTIGSRADFQDVGGFPPPFSFSGQPAMSVPMHWTADGLPVGVQLIAAPGRDELLLQLAARLEAAQPWADRWPVIAVE